MAWCYLFRPLYSRYKGKDSWRWGCTLLSFSRACSRSPSPQLGGGKRTLAKEETWGLGVSIAQVRVLHPKEVRKKLVTDTVTLFSAVVSIRCMPS